ncbi:MAG: DUF3299 domain-containing protein [Rhodocyclaceae bacterium]|nr:DUF3299 domain-containing protein [Rhodocyclaceae bacterium]
MKTLTMGLALVACVLVGPAAAQEGEYAIGEKARPEVAHPPPAGVRDLVWDDLVPADWNPRQLLDDAGFDDMQDNDPRANELLDQLRVEWDKAPVVAGLDGQRIRLPGFVVALEGDETTVREFLLVPYFGACIHVPPPPSNQVVHVKPAKPFGEKLAMYPVWVTGKLITSGKTTEMGAAGYRIEAAQVEPYPWR